MFLGHDWRFWLAVVGAAFFKLITSPHHTLSRAILTGAVAIYCPVLFTEPALRFLQWDDSYKVLIAAVLTLTGEGVMRWIMNLTPEQMINLWKGFKK